MVIRFTSTLTDEDETRIATAILKAVGNLLAIVPISYSLRIETTAGEIVEDGRAAPGPLTSHTLPLPNRESNDLPRIQPAVQSRYRKAW